MKLISEKMSRKQLSEKLCAAGKELTVVIREMKKRGALIEKKEYTELHKSKKRRQVFCFLAVTEELFMQESDKGTA